jgi:hypothetical protein
VKGGQGGNAVQVAYLDPGPSGSAGPGRISVAVKGLKITVTLATDPSGVILSTAAQVKVAVEANHDARRLVSVALAGGNDGTGIVTALAATNLSGGVDDVEDLDTSTFASLGAGAQKSVVLAGPLGLLKLLADQGAGATTVDAHVVIEPALA